MTDSPVIDHRVIDTLRQLTPPGEPDVLTEVLQMFLQEVPPRIEKLRNAWATGDIEGMYRAAHSLKGSAGNIGAQRLYAVCKQLDDRTTTPDPARTVSLIDELRSELAKVESEIHTLMGSSGPQ